MDIETKQTVQISTSHIVKNKAVIMGLLDTKPGE